MPQTQTNTDISELLKEKLQTLPRAVADAISSANLEKNLRALADTHRLHVDQWQLLENEIMLTLLGFQPVDALEENIRTHVSVSPEIARAIALDANKIVFQPIRDELERQLEHPEAKEKEVSDLEAARTAALDQSSEATPESSPTTPVPAASTPSLTPTPLPPTPPSPKPDVKVTRPSESTGYRPGETSTQRANVHDDPYREPPL